MTVAVVAMGKADAKSSPGSRQGGQAQKGVPLSPP